MGFAQGANIRVRSAFETTVGTPPAGGSTWFVCPIVSHSLGQQRDLIESNLLGQGRETFDPVPDVANNDGNIVVPVDLRNFGRWLKLFMGSPTTTTVSTDKQHVFTSGAATLPSLSMEVGNPEVPAYTTHYGMRANTMEISLQRSGLLDATIGVYAIGETAVAATGQTGSTPTSLAVTQFGQATGQIKKDGTQIGSIVEAKFSISNEMDKIETIQPNGQIEDSVPGQFKASGSITALFKDTVLLNAATASPPTPIDLSFGWTVGTYSLIFDMPRVFLPQPKRPVDGPKGIRATFDWRASGQNGNALTATLLNDVASY